MKSTWIFKASRLFTSAFVLLWSVMSCAPSGPKPPPASGPPFTINSPLEGSRDVYKRQVREIVHQSK